MILQRLHELSVRKHLLEDPAFIRRDVACRIDINDDGTWLGIHDLRERIELPPKTKKGKPKSVLNNGMTMGIPIRPVVWDDKINDWKTTDPAASGKEKPALFMADTLGRLLPATRLILEKDRAKCDAQRSTFWRFLRYAIEQTGADALRPLLKFAVSCEANDELEEKIAAEIEAKGLTLTNIATFAIQSDNGLTLLDNEQLCDFWRDFYNQDTQSQQSASFQGHCQVTGKLSPIGDSVKARIKGLVSIGCRADAYLVTGLDSAESYNLSGARSAMVSETGVSSFTRAANALIGNDLDGKKTSYRIGGVMFLFWTRADTDSAVFTIFEPDPADVAKLLESASKGRHHAAVDRDDDFYMLVVSGNSARVVVRDYLETSLRAVQMNLGRWFDDLRIANVSQEGQGHPTSVFPLWLLAVATALDGDAVAPDTPSRLTLAAIQGRPVPGSILLACLRRLRAEGAAGFRAARLALIKLILKRQGIKVTETLDHDENHPAYLYGRLLCMFEQIQYAAIPGVNASVVDKFYGVFSAAPALVFNRLFNNAQNHLRKLKSEKPGSFVSLDKRLTELVRLLPAAPPSGQLSMQDQGRFALGYYHQRAKQFTEISDRKAAKAAATEQALRD